MKTNCLEPKFWLNDGVIRSALKQYLSDCYDTSSDTVILDELGLLHGTVRADLVVIGDLLHGYELKSDCDTLERLPEQSRIYSSVFDKVTLVVGYRHAFEAMKFIPNWWGVKIAEKQFNDEIAFLDLREAENNPSIDPLSVVKLLWKEEALSLLSEISSVDILRSQSRLSIYSALIEKIDVDLVRVKVREKIRSRKGWRFDELQIQDGD